MNRGLSERQRRQVRCGRTNTLESRLPFSNVFLLRVAPLLSVAISFWRVASTLALNVRSQCQPMRRPNTVYTHFTPEQTHSTHASPPLCSPPWTTGLLALEKGRYMQQQKKRRQSFVEAREKENRGKQKDRRCRRQASHNRKERSLERIENRRERGRCERATARIYGVHRHRTTSTLIPLTPRLSRHLAYAKQPWVQGSSPWFKHGLCDTLPPSLTFTPFPADLTCYTVVFPLCSLAGLSRVFFWPF